jgi:1-acyl-sn-glycerol-3-phosphate acyltransferase
MSVSPLLRAAAWKVGLLLARVIDAIVYQVRIDGSSRLPSSGPMVFIGNHGSVLDPLWIARVAGRPVRFMANERLFRGRVSGPFVRLFGAFPKRKFEPDAPALRQLIRLCREGEAVGLFPEGRRTWDGCTLPLVPGAGRLVKLLDAPVVFVRNRTSYLRTPQWARHTRWVPIRLEVSGPVRFPPAASEEDVEREIVRRITIDPLSTRAPRFSAGWRMAVGLPDLLWACPRCFALAGLRPVGRARNRLQCRPCGALWRLHVDHRLEALSGGAEGFHIAEACQRIAAHFGCPPVIDREQLRRDGTLLARDEARVQRRDPAGPETVGKGRLQLNASELRLCDERQGLLWAQPLAGIHAAFIQGDRVLVRSGQQLFYLDVSGDSANKWWYFLTAYVGALHGRLL